MDQIKQVLFSEINDAPNIFIPLYQLKNEKLYYIFSKRKVALFLRI